MKKTFVALSIGGARPFLGHIDEGEEWNGWLCPWFDSSEIEKIKEDLDEFHAEEENPTYQLQKRKVFYNGKPSKEMTVWVLIETIEEVENDESVVTFEETIYEPMVHKGELLYQIGGYDWVWIEDIEVDKEGNQIKVKMWDDEISFDGTLQPLYYGDRKKTCFEPGVFDSEDSKRFYDEYEEEIDEIIINKSINHENN